MLVLTGHFSGLASAQHPIPKGNANWNEAGEFIFLENEVMDIHVTMDETDLDTFLGNRNLDYFVPCTVQVINSKIDETYQDVGIRPRGNSQRGSKKNPWKLSFNEFVQGRKLHGIEKMNLASESTDPSMARESLAYEIMRSMGVAAGRTNYVWLTINDGTKVKGVYNNVEQVDENFVKAWFDNKDGDLYKCRWKDDGAKLLWKSPGDAATYEAMEDYEEKNTGNFQRLADFIDFVCNSDTATFNDGIKDWINVDSFLRAQSVDMYLGQWDGLWIFPNNYYLYWDTEIERFEYIPWDLDHSMGMDYWIIPFFFGTDWARKSFNGWGNGSTASQPGGGNGPPLIRRLLDIPEYEDRLAFYEKELASQFAHPATLASSIERISTLLAPLAYTGTFSGSSMENGYTPNDFTSSWDSPPNYSPFNTPATWGVRPFLETRSAFVRDGYPSSQLTPPVCINEVVSKNESGITDEAGEYEDWVEIYNSSSQSFDLSGYYLSDRYGNSRGWEVPSGTTIPANGYLIIWCDNEDTQGPLHANFKLTSEGEGVYLFKPDTGFNVLVSSLLCPALNDDEAWGRLPDGMRNARIYTASTPLAPNETGLFELLKEGFVPDSQTLYAIGATPNKPVAFVWSMNRGSFLVNGTRCAGITLGLDAPVTVASIVSADFNGTAILSVPQGAAPAGIFLQSVDAVTCKISNIIEF